ncbi:restriction endonuclease subunit S [Nocardia sp. 004]|uniref:restriction endonuclease subunit S n=1 Tax=Nocardia sp. 004 TaxID=3385978 RepID=UPI00399F1E19
MTEWRTVEFCDAITDSSSGHHKILQSNYQKNGLLPVVDQGAKLIAGYVDDRSLAYSGPLPVIAFGDHTRHVKYIDFPFTVGADGVKLLHPTPIFEPKYLFHHLRYLNIPNAGYSRHFKFLKTAKFVAPPMDEQRNIAQVLDQVDALREKRRKAVTLLDELTQSIFLDMFGDPMQNPKNWPVVLLETLGNLDRGVSKHRPRNDPKLLGGPYPLVQTGDVANSGGYITSASGTYSEIGLHQSRLWPQGTLCITIAANIAKTGILTFDACFPDSIVGFTSENSTAEYVRGIILLLQESIEKLAPESAQKNINLKTLRNLSVPHPPAELIREYAQRVTALNATKATHEAQLDRLNALFASLQSRAFRGELWQHEAEDPAGEGVP